MIGIPPPWSKILSNTKSNGGKIAKFDYGVDKITIDFPSFLYLPSPALHYKCSKELYNACGIEKNIYFTVFEYPGNCQRILKKPNTLVVNGIYTRLFVWNCFKSKIKLVLVKLNLNYFIPFVQNATSKLDVSRCIFFVF